MIESSKKVEPWRTDVKAAAETLNEEWKGSVEVLKEYGMGVDDLVAHMKGEKDITAALGTQDYWRLRLGVGHPGVKSEVVHWVLKKPSLDHRIAIDQCIDRSLKALPHLVAGEMDKATMLIHTSKPPRPKPPRPPKADTPPAAAAE